MSKNRERYPEVRDYDQSNEHVEWDVVHFDERFDVSHAHSIVVAVRHYDNFVSPFVEVLSEVVNVAFHSPKVGIEKVGDEADFHGKERIGV